MHDRLRRTLACGLLSLWTGAMSGTCLAQSQSGPGIKSTVREIGGAIRGLFGTLEGALNALTDPKGKELATLVEAGDLEAAARYFMENEAELVKSDRGKALLPKIADGLNTRLAEGAAELAGRLSAISVPLPQPEWQRVAQELSQAHALLSSYRTVPLLAREDLRSGAIVQLEQALAAAEKRISEGAEPAFAAYDHSTQPLFLQAYPARLNPVAIAETVDRGARSLIAAIERGTPEQANRLAVAYGRWISNQENRTLLSAAYLQAYLRANGWVEPLPFVHRLQLIQALNRAGLDGPPAGDRLKVVRLGGDSQDAARWHPRRIGMQGIEMQQQELPRWAKALAANPSDEIFVLLDPSPPVLQRNIRSVAAADARRTVGQRNEPNPAWEAASQELQSAQADLRQAEAQDRRNQAQAQEMARQARNSLGALSAATMSAAGASALSAARSRVKQAEDSLAATPRTTVQNVTRPYRVATATVEIVKIQEVSVYVIEAARGRFGRASFSETSRAEVAMKFGIDPQDPDRAAMASENEQARKRLLDFARAGSPLALEQAWARLVASPPAVDLPLAQIAAAVAENAGRRQIAAPGSWAQGEREILQIVRNSP